jgi:hypothetical protein
MAFDIDVLETVGVLRPEYRLEIRWVTRQLTGPEWLALT